jgi:hypothetical protein
MMRKSFAYIPILLRTRNQRTISHLSCDFKIFYLSESSFSHQFLDLIRSYILRFFFEDI